LLRPSISALQGKGFKIFSHFKYIYRQHATASQATRCQTAVDWVGLV